MNWADWRHRWPLAAHSRFVDARPYRWHVQQLGTGPDLLFLHGAGAATHSWRALAPLLADQYRCTLIDLPGHGFTTRVTGRSGLDAMAEDIGTLLGVLNVQPDAIIGHSAGATIALRLALTRPVPVVSLNGAFAMFDGVAGFLFPLMAKIMALNPLTVPLFTASVSDIRVRRLLEQTGSRIDEETVTLYGALMRDRAHVAGALAKMASWQLDRLVRDAAGLQSPVLLLAGEADGTVPAHVSRDMAATLPDAQLRVEPGLGHLMHEEAPDLVAGAVCGFLVEAGACPDYSTGAPN